MSPLRIAVFLVVVSTVLGGAHYYVWARLVRDTALPEPWHSIASWTIGGLGLLIVAGLVSMRTLPRAISSPLLWVVYIWFGLIFFVLMLLGAVDLLRALSSLVTAAPPDPERRAFLARLYGAIVGAGALSLGAFGLGNVLRPVAVKRVKVSLPGLPVAAGGFRIVQLTDVHIGPTIGKDFLDEVVAKVNALEPDLVAITGDLVDGSVAELGQHVAPLGRLKAKEGVFFVTGNHEYYSGADAWIAQLKTLGVQTLRNERREIAPGLWLAGIDDLTARGGDHAPDLPRALADRDPAQPVVLLAHQPKQFLEAAEHGVDLTLSGHTHGGQIWPFVWLVSLVQPYVAGLHRKGQSQLYVSRGTGFWGPPLRVGAPPEITLLLLQPA